MEQQLSYDIIMIILTSAIPITLGAILYNPIRRKFEARRAEKARKIEIEVKRDATLERVEAFLQKVQEDHKKTGKLLEQSIKNQLSEMNTLEITLIAIQGYKLNGEVTDALKAVRAQKTEFMQQLASLSCADIGQAAD